MPWRRARELMNGVLKELEVGKLPGRGAGGRGRADRGADAPPPPDKDAVWTSAGRGGALMDDNGVDAWLDAAPADTAHGCGIGRSMMVEKGDEAPPPDEEFPPRLVGVGRRTRAEDGDRTRSGE